MQYDEDEDEEIIDKIAAELLDKNADFDRKKEFYVKAEDLKKEIQKFQDSKKETPDRKRKNIKRAWNHDNEDLHKILVAPKILWIQL